MPKKVLVVDDEPSIADLVSLILTEKGYEVSIANDGNQGLKQFESVEPDLVITDLCGDLQGLLSPLEILRRDVAARLGYDLRLAVNDIRTITTDYSRHVPWGREAA